MKVLNIYQAIGSNETTPKGGMFSGTMEFFGIKELDDFLKDAKDEKDILVRISTPGGSVFEAVGIYDKLKASSKNITMLCEGVVASAGTIIMLAGQKRQSLENTSFLIHNSRISQDYLEDATAEDYKKRYEDLTVTDNLIKKIYKDVLPDKIMDIYELMTKEEVVSADKMIELGFITEKVSVVDNIKNIFNNKTKKTNEIMELGDIKTGIDNILAKLNILGAKTPQNMMVKLKDGQEIEVTELKEGSDTTAPDGVHELEDGKKITVTGGKITKIEEKEAEPATEDAKDKEIATLKAELEALKKEKEKTTAEMQKVANEVLIVKQAVAKFNLPADPNNGTKKAPEALSHEDAAYKAFIENKKLKQTKK